MTTKTNRSDLVRDRRSSKPSTRSAGKPKRYLPESLFLPVEPRVDTRRPSRQVYNMGLATGSARRLTTTRPAAKQSRRNNGYDYAFTLGRADVRAPALTMPQFGPRWISLGLTLVLAFLLYGMWNGSFFKVSAAEISGNQRLGATDINAAITVIGGPIFKAVPEKIAANLLATYPDLESAKVQVVFPNKLRVEIVERVPVLAWYQNNSLTWVDGSGVAFMPRGEAQGLIQVAATGTPPRVQVDPTKAISAQVFIDPQMVQAMTVLAPYVPAGIPMTYDPAYGMGWQDPRGWAVYFGKNTLDIPMKLTVYQSIVDTLTQQGIQPTLISV